MRSSENHSAVRSVLVKRIRDFAVRGVRGSENQRCVRLGVCRSGCAGFRELEICAIRGERGSDNQRCVRLEVCWLRESELLRLGFCGV